MISFDIKTGLKKMYTFYKYERDLIKMWRKENFTLTCDEYLVLHFPQSLQDMRIENKIKKTPNDYSGNSLKMHLHFLDSDLTKTWI